MSSISHTEVLYDKMTSVPAGGTKSEEKKWAQHRVRARGGGETHYSKYGNQVMGSLGAEAGGGV